MPLVFLQPTKAKAQAEELIERLRRNENVVVDNWEVLAFLNDMLQWTDNLTLGESVQYVGARNFSVADIRRCIVEDEECRPDQAQYIPAVLTGVTSRVTVGNA